jgi:hypothetical protein
MYKVLKDKYGDRYVEVPVAFTLNVYLRDEVDEDDEEGDADLPLEVDSSIVNDALDEMGRIDLGEEVLNNIQLY